MAAASPGGYVYLLIPSSLGKIRMTEDNSLSERLAEHLVDEIVKALALPPSRMVRQGIALLTRRPMQRFMELAAELDCVVGTEGLAAGARWLLPRFVKSYSASGVENLPAAGPLVIASNHPASVDSVVISAHVPRRDYKIIIGEIPFFKNLPNIRRNALFAPDRSDTHGRLQVMREMIRHLKNDGSILIFPRGGIEPDPAWMAAPDSEFDQWSRSLEILLKHVPHAQVLVTIVSGVISKRAMRHPITWLRKARADRQRLAFIYQFIRQVIADKEVFGLTPHVTFGDLIRLERGSDRDHLGQTIICSARQVLQQHLEHV